MKLEVCCGNIASVRAAIEGGADRVELCRDLELDGLTPSREMIGEAYVTPPGCWFTFSFALAREISFTTIPRSRRWPTR